MLLLQSQATIGSSETEPGLLLGVHSLQVSLGHGHYNVLLQRSHCLLITSITIVICQSHGEPLALPRGARRREVLFPIGAVAFQI